MNIHPSSHTQKAISICYLTPKVSSRFKTRISRWCASLSIRSSCGSHGSYLLDHSKEQTGYSNENLEWKIHGSYCSTANPKSFWTGRARAPCSWQSNKLQSAKLVIAHPVFWATQRPSIIHCPSRLLVCPLGDPEMGILGKMLLFDAWRFSVYVLLIWVKGSGWPLRAEET